ncbi:MAG: DUF6249 domain-containing protein, partial [Phocaeicola sp.]
KEFMNETDGQGGDNLIDKNNELKNQGIQGMFQGIGVGVFLWLMTDEIELAGIGFILFCFGLGQLIMAYTNVNRKTKEHKKESDTLAKKPQPIQTEEKKME